MGTYVLAFHQISRRCKWPRSSVLFIQENRSPSSFHKGCTTCLTATFWVWDIN